MSPALEPLAQLLPYCTLWFLGMVILWAILGPGRRRTATTLKQRQRQAARGTASLLPLLLLLLLMGIGLSALTQIFDWQWDLADASDWLPALGSISLPVIDREIGGLPLLIAFLAGVILLLLGALRALINKVTGPIRQRRSG
ncbi:MAG: hypothetical protein KDD73_06340 [Anaerolineales bacterium]|nr:hypothetical protein [Anaerolineales bacterium]MCB9128470.1 hypothetical protein [Ardenticatenales bacterium]MCB9172690.1 hypothetical protein [Ardenticatenales bacterium]